jgi:ABC-type glycerol-3-phosphate transport system permease component
VVGNKLQIRLWQVAINALLLFAVFLLIIPYAYMISASFKEGSEIFSIPIEILPQGLYMGNYELLFTET